MFGKEPTIPLDKIQGISIRDTLLRGEEALKDRPHQAAEPRSSLCKAIFGMVRGVTGAA